MAYFLDSIRDYEHESGKAVASDERDSSEFVDIFFGKGDFKIEEVKQPLFVTEDGVECFDRDDYIAIGDDFSKRNMRAYNCDAPYSPDVIRFKHESNADEYIWKNKRVFSYEEMKKANIDINWCTADIYNKTKERCK